MKRETDDRDQDIVTIKIEWRNRGPIPPRTPAQEAHIRKLREEYRRNMMLREHKSKSTDAESQPPTAE